ncbi:hypothetical protein [Microbacterium amylolyticum]|uniref:Uncharacterized protein n=1 Tax=Microbacterium amylolyticum TaxID=936337 RepID=A0ABS4ZK97_9MICO|nr:hypothetical protein [Microbacterium amylolyticum]MBP2437720.1 hypothetical protein [Microbacterium amylolyticum]
MSEKTTAPVGWAVRAQGACEWVTWVLASPEEQEWEVGERLTGIHLEQAQYGLAAIQILALIGDELPEELRGDAAAGSRVIRV